MGRLVSVAVGASLGARLDGIIEGYEDDTLGLVEGRELAVGGRERIELGLVNTLSKLPEMKEAIATFDRLS